MVYFLATIFVLWRVSLFFIAWLGGKIHSFTPSFPYSDIFFLPSGLPSWLWSFANFDGVHYLTIVKSGYSAQFTQVFFPLYPIIIRTIHVFVPFINTIIIGLFLSNLFFFLTLITFWKLLRLDCKKDSILWVVIFLVFFPTSFFFGSLYTESLFLFLVLSAFLAAREKRWWLAGILGGLASATRLTGIFLLPALLWEWQNNKFKIQNSKLIKCYLKILHFLFSILHSPILYLVPLGLILYMIYLQLKFGDWLYFWHAQPVFGAQRSGGAIILLPQVVFRYAKILLTIPNNNYSFWLALWEFTSVFVGYGLWFMGLIKKVRPSYMIFSLLAIFVPTLTGTFSSMPRYILVAFPIFIVLGMIKSKIIKTLILVASCLLFVIFTFLFTRGYWVA